MAENLILAENTLTTQFLDVYGVYGFTIPFGGDFSEFPLTLGDECVVVWDGAEYKVTVGDSSAIIADTMFVENGSAFGLSGNNEPFVIAWDRTGATFIALTDTSETSHTVEIYQVVSYDIVLKDHAGNDLDAIEDAVEIRIPTTGGGLQSFVAGTRVEKTIIPNFAEGDMEVTPRNGEVFSKVTVQKPESLVPENIPKGVTIAGVEGSSSSGGDLDAYLNGSLTKISSEVQTLRSYAIYDDPNDPTIVSIDFPLLERVGNYGIYNLRYLETLKVDRLESVGNYFLGSCYIISELEFPALKTVGSNFLSYCKALTKIDFGSLSNIPEGSFISCSALTAVILRSTTPTTVQEYPTNTYGGPFGDSAAPNAYIYVPSDLLSTYKAATGWKRMSSRIRAIEDYPDICG